MLRPLRPFALERYLAPREFRSKIPLCCSDSESWNMLEIMEMADDDSKARWNELRLGYTTTEGLEALREEVAARHFTTLGKDDVVVDAPGDAMYVTMRAMLSPGDHVVCTYPGYQSLYETARSIGCEVSFWEAQEGPGGVPHFDPARLQSLVHPDTRMVVVNFPHNPTGYLPTPQEWAAVVAAVEGTGAYLFADEMYRGLELDPADRLASAADVCSRGISLGGLSKSAGMPGLRIGWVASRDKQVIKRVLEVKDFTTICSSAPSEIVALAALRRWDDILARQRGILDTNLAAWDAFCRRWAGVVQGYTPRAGTVAFPRLLVPGASVEDLADSLLEQEGAMLLPGSVYEAPGNHDRFRVGYGRANWPQALQALERQLERQFGAPAPA